MASSGNATAPADADTDADVVVPPGGQKARSSAAMRTSVAHTKWPSRSSRLARWRDMPEAEPVRRKRRGVS